MKNFCPIFFIILLAPQLAFSAYIFEEEFNYPPEWWSGNPPYGWIINDDGDHQDNDWHQDAFGEDKNAGILGTVPESPMDDTIYHTGIDCSSYELCTLDYWIQLNWWPYHTYTGTFTVIGSADGFSSDWRTLFETHWNDNILADIYSYDISSWADNQSNVGIMFRLHVNTSYGFDFAYLDKVHISGTRNEIQPISLGNVKALYH